MEGAEAKVVGIVNRCDQIMVVEQDTEADGAGKDEPARYPGAQTPSPQPAEQALGLGPIPDQQLL